jgi:hypothetical protein
MSDCTGNSMSLIEQQNHVYNGICSRVVYKHGPLTG